MSILGITLASSTLTHALPVTTRFTGTVFNNAGGAFDTDLGDSYEMLINYDSSLLIGSPLDADTTQYISNPGESLITFSWASDEESFASDNSFEVSMTIHNGTGGIGDPDRFSLRGTINATTTLRVTLVSSFGENPLSSVNPPATSADWGDGVGTQWSVGEIFIDREFDRMSSIISTLDVVSTPDNGGSLPLIAGSSLMLAGVYQIRRRFEQRT